LHQETCASLLYKFLERASNCGVNPNLFSGRMTEEPPAPSEAPSSVWGRKIFEILSGNVYIWCFIWWMVHLLLTSGDEPSHSDTQGWHYGPRSLHVNDDEVGV